MALIQCPECKKEGVSDHAPSCPQCGYPLANSSQAQWEAREARREGRPGSHSSQVQWETCQIQWGVTSQFLGNPAPFSKNFFWAEATSPVQGTYPAGCSPEFGVGFSHGLGMWLERGGRGTNWDSRPPPNDTNTVTAHRALVNLLLTDGWEPADFRGQEWWQHSFRRHVRTEEDGWMVLTTVPKPYWGGHWMYDPEVQDESDPKVVQGLAKGSVRKERDVYWFEESFCIEIVKENGWELISVIPATHDGIHMVTFRMQSEDG